MKLGIVVLFSLTSFLAAVLLFSAEPMIGKMVLPLFGGTPAVWNSCLVYFQVMLLLGYALSGDLPAGMGIERRRISMPFLAVLAVLLFLGYLMQPLSLSVGVTVPAEIERSPAGSLLGILWISTSLPLLLVSSTSPLVQRWFAETGHPRAHDPYFLYAASNAGSLLALSVYPFAIEPHSSLPAEARVVGRLRGPRAPDDRLRNRSAAEPGQPRGLDRIRGRSSRRRRRGRWPRGQRCGPCFTGSSWSPSPRAG